jgi:hypothetical protein
MTTETVACQEENGREYVGASALRAASTWGARGRRPGDAVITSPVDDRREPLDIVLIGLVHLRSERNATSPSGSAGGGSVADMIRSRP